MSAALEEAWARLANTPSRVSSELQAQFPRINPQVRVENPAFVEGALYANDHLMDAWRILEFDREPSPFVDATKAMLVDLINHIAEQARLEADFRYPPFAKPTARDIQLGKFVPVQHD